MKISFIQMPAWGRDCPPYTMCLLAALARGNNAKAYLFDLNNILYHSCSDKYREKWDNKDYYSFWEDKESVNLLLEENNGIIELYTKKILATQSEVIGFTVQFSSLWASLYLAEQLKRKDPKRIIVFGGPDCAKQQKADFLVRHDFIDIVVYAEGEKPLLEIIKNQRKLNEKPLIKGCLIYKDGHILDGGYSQPIDDLDTLPLPDYSDFKDDLRLRMYRQPERLDIFDSRGCVMGCHFCSEWQFWGKFRSKSGKRIYNEVSAHIKNFPWINYFYFIGSLVNGDIQALEKFCDLIIENNLKIDWAGQAIIRPEMTKKLLEKMKLSGCSWIGYGIESGSQKILNKMNKRFSPETAGRILRQTKECGISIQANFMFGLPTEETDDFRQTIDFFKNNRRYIDSVLASQSFCVIDKGTYLYQHPREFGIKYKEHHLYWESNNGANNYPERLRRYEEFCRIALETGIPETSGVLRNKPDKWHLLGDYFLFKKEFSAAIDNYLKAEKYGIKSRGLSIKIADCYERNAEYEKAAETLNRSLHNEETTQYKELTINKIDYLNNLIATIRTLNLSPRIQGPDYASIGSEELDKILRHYNKTYYNNVDLEEMLSCLQFNEREQFLCKTLYSLKLWSKLSNYILVNCQIKRRETVLFGYPYWLVIDPCNICNLSCPFCPTGQKRDTRTKGKLSLSDFKDIIDKLFPYLIHVDLVNWGEPLLNDDIFDMVKYAKQHFIDVKTDSNLHHLDEKRTKKLLESGLDKIIVSIDGIKEETYGKYRVGGNLETVLANLKLLVKNKRYLRVNNPYISWQFLVFKHNEHEIEEVKRIAREIGVDHVGITKAFIGNKDWFPVNPQYSNYTESEKESHESTYDLFKRPPEKFCRWPWEAITVNTNGSISVCCSVENEIDDFGNIFDAPFEELWNNGNYVNARRIITNTAYSSNGHKNICSGCRHLGLTNIDIHSCSYFFDLL